MRIVFFGTDEFASSILEHLLSVGFEIVGVVTRADKPKGRSKEPSAPPVKEFLQKVGYRGSLYQPVKASSEEFVATLKELNPDLFVVVSYGQILKQNLLDLPLKGAVNVHPSLLPKYRGPSPMQSAVLAGDKEVGVTIMEMVLAMDAGDILKVAKIPLGEEVTYGEIQGELCELAKVLLVAVLGEIEQGTVSKIKQVESMATYTKKIEPEESFIDWNQTAEEIHNKIRGMSPKPGARAFLEVHGEKKLLKLLKSRKQPHLRGQSGDVLFFDKENGFVVACREGSVEILSLQLEGKKQVSAKEFINGFPRPKALL